MKLTTKLSGTHDATLNNPYDLIQWVNRDPKTECMLLDPYAPFLTYRNEGKPQIVATPIKGHETRNSSIPYGIQGYAWVELGKNEYVSQRRFTTTCGNPYCMNPDHIVPCNSNYNKPKVKSTDGSVIKLKEYQQVMRYSAQGMKPKDIAERVSVCEGTINKWRSQMIMDLLGEDYKWSDLLIAIDVADGMRWSKDKREGKSQKLLVEMLSQSKKEPVTNLFED